MASLLVPFLKFCFPLVHSPFSSYISTNTVITPFFKILGCFLTPLQWRPGALNQLTKAFRDLAAACLFCLPFPCYLHAQPFRAILNAPVLLYPHFLSLSPQPCPHTYLFSISSPLTCFTPALSCHLEGISCLTNLCCRIQEGRGCF